MADQHCTKTPIPLGLCQCGCGLSTNITSQNHQRRGLVKGRPYRFRVGHHASRGTPAPYRANNTSSGRVYSHILIAEKALGKPLPPGAQVHHVDGNGLNNEHRNLVVCQDQAYHMLLHVRAKILKAGGNQNTDKMCCVCQRPRPYAAFNISTKDVLGLQGTCRDCGKARRQARREQR